MKRFLIVVACLACVLGFAGPATAVTLNADYLIGTIVPGTPSNPGTEVVFSNLLVEMYNTSSPASPHILGSNTLTLGVGSNVASPPLPSLTEIGAQKVDLPNFLVDLTGYQYLYAKFGGFAALFWLDGLTEIDGINLDPPSGVRGGGLSHFSLYNPTQVPEGATLMLLGFGLVGVGTLRRFMKR